MWQILELLSFGERAFRIQAPVTDPSPVSAEPAWAQMLLDGSVEIDFVFVSVAVGIVLAVVSVALIRGLVPQKPPKGSS